MQMIYSSGINSLIFRIQFAAHSDFATYIRGGAFEGDLVSLKLPEVIELVSINSSKYGLCRELCKKNFDLIFKLNW